MADTLIPVAYGWADIAFTVDTLVREQSGSVRYAPPGTVELNTGIEPVGPILVLANTSMAFCGPGTLCTNPYVPMNTPNSFVAAGWSVADSATATAADITFTTAPVASPNVTLTDYQVSVDGGAYATLGSGAATGTRTKTGVANGAHTFRVRAVGITSDGRTVFGAPSDLKSATVA